MVPSSGACPGVLLALALVSAGFPWPLPVLHRAMGTTRAVISPPPPVSGKGCEPLPRSGLPKHRCLGGLRTSAAFLTVSLEEDWRAIALMSYISSLGLIMLLQLPKVMRR